jgi:hypothetical protein
LVCLLVRHWVGNAKSPMTTNNLLRDYVARHPSHEPQIVKILRQNLVTKMSPQVLISPKSRPDIYHFLVEYCSLQKNIGPIEDSMSVA